MNKYGINNVRGGSYSELELSEEQINILHKEINMVNNNHEDISLKRYSLEKYENKTHNIIFINKIFKNPVITNNYIWYWECSICNKNAVGTIKCSNFNFAITKPTYLDDMKNIKKIAICDICLNKFELDNFKNPKTLVDPINNKYQLVGFENGQYI